MSAMRKDEFSTALILREVELKNCIPLKTTGNANCMFNAASLLLVGNKSLSDVKRLLIAGELFCFSEFYIQTIQDRFLEIENEMPYSEATAFSTNPNRSGQERNDKLKESPGSYLHRSTQYMPYEQLEWDGSNDGLVHCFKTANIQD